MWFTPEPCFLACFTPDLFHMGAEDATSAPPTFRWIKATVVNKALTQKKCLDPSRITRNDVQDGQRLKKYTTILIFQSVSDLVVLGKRTFSPWPNAHVNIIEFATIEFTVFAAPHTCWICLLCIEKKLKYKENKVVKTPKSGRAEMNLAERAFAVRKIIHAGGRNNIHR